MSPTMTDLISAFEANSHAYALFVSGLQRSDQPSADQVRQAVSKTIGAFGCSGCAARVVKEFSDHPEAAVIRMRWARAAAGAAFA